MRISAERHDLLDTAFLVEARRHDSRRREPMPRVDSQPEPPAGVAVEVAWRQLGSAVEAALARGHRVIALASARAEARSGPLVEGLAAGLGQAGRRVATADTARWSHGGEDAAGCDAELLLVDATGWLGPGRLRRDRLASRCRGCDAVIVVRPEERPFATGLEKLLEAVGVECLGEVVTGCDELLPAPE